MLVNDFDARRVDRVTSIHHIVKLLQHVCQDSDHILNRTPIIHVLKRLNELHLSIHGTFSRISAIEIFDKLRNQRLSSRLFHLSYLGVQVACRLETFMLGLVDSLNPLCACLA